MKSTRFWIILFAALLLVSAGISAYVLTRETGGVYANIYQDGECVHSVDLSRVTAPYTIEITGIVTNTILIERDRIRVSEASCPDQICVHQGFICDSALPIVCLPNRLVIKIENAPGGAYDEIAMTAASSVGATGRTYITRRLLL